MSTAKAKPKPSGGAAIAAPDSIVAYKGFERDMTCRGFQFEVGKTYEHEGNVVACESGFHACEYPLHALRYYKPASSVYAVVQQAGALERHVDDSKIASSKITVTAQIDIAGLVKAAIKYTMDRCTPAKGASSDAAHDAVQATAPNKSCAASGDYGAATASGYCGAATASGYCGAATASGNSGAATASGRNGKARGKDGCALFLVRRDSDFRITHAKALIVGQDDIKPDTFYRLDEHGNPAEAA